MGNLQIKLTYVHREISRHGRVCFYYRAPGKPRIRLPDDPLSDEFSDAIKDAREGKLTPAKQTRRRACKLGSVDALVAAYYISPEWAGLGDTTKNTRRRTLEKLRQTAGELPARGLTPKILRNSRDARRETPAAANNLLKVISALYSWGMETDLVHTNPATADKVKRLKMRKGGFHTWTHAECQQYEKHFPIGTQARLVYALAYYLAARRQDLPFLGPQHRMADGFMRLSRHKTDTPQEVFISAPLAKILDASPLTNLTYITTEYGKPFTVKGLGNKMRKWCDEAGLPQCSLHGLRKAIVAHMAEKGFSVKDMQSVSDHDSLSELAVYAADAQRRDSSKRVLQEMFPEHSPAPISGDDARCGK